MWKVLPWGLAEMYLLHIYCVKIDYKCPIMNIFHIISCDVYNKISERGMSIS